MRVPLHALPNDRLVQGSLLDELVEGTDRPRSNILLLEELRVHMAHGFGFILKIRTLEGWLLERESALDLIRAHVQDAVASLGLASLHSCRILKAVASPRGRLLRLLVAMHRWEH